MKPAYDNLENFHEYVAEFMTGVETEICSLSEIEDTDRVYECHGSINGKVLGIVYKKQDESLVVFADTITIPNNTRNILAVNAGYLTDGYKDDLVEILVEGLHTLEFWKDSLVALENLENNTNKEW